MSKEAHYATEFKQEAVKQLIKHGDSVNYVSECLGSSHQTLYAWSKTCSKPPQQGENVPANGTCLLTVLLANGATHNVC